MYHEFGFWVVKSKKTALINYQDIEIRVDSCLLDSPYPRDPSTV
jgi:hypothetical protein